METKLMFLVESYLTDFPIGLYYVTDYGDYSCYYINGISHHKSRFIEPSSLLLELF
jgi:hypothetical protein